MSAVQLAAISTGYAVWIVIGLVAISGLLTLGVFGVVSTARWIRANRNSKDYLER
jgi:hypothetical protein